MIQLVCQLLFFERFYLPNYVIKKFQLFFIVRFNELQSVTFKTIGQMMKIGSISKAFSGTPVLSKHFLLQNSDHVPNLLSHLVTPITIN